ncbi:MFS general substrate transporter [Microthyrium microscopicum]|uniref:MFS general substrate transporter n=1 Tax=Microthyrium microscopicum TaxID=703497 RepID=A0A6A6UFZ7_9PEZI|nr:MFS general substrate transporter [Microthyrium microscopicum]
MAFGILEDRLTPRPPGTVPLDSKASNRDDGLIGEFDHLKRKGDIILQPQPTDSLNDPLNWTYKRKVRLFFVLLVSSIAVSGIQGMLGTGVRLIATQFHTDFPTVTKILRPPGLITGTITLFISSAAASIWGKRVQFVLASGLVLVWTLTGYFANSLAYYQGLSVIGGLAASPLELLISPVIADMIYVHERGTLVALSAIVNVVGADASHIISGNIIDKLGLKYTFIISFGVWIPIALAIYFFVYETTFNRTSYNAKQKAKALSGTVEFDLEKEKMHVVQVEDLALSRSTTPDTLPAVTEAPPTRRQLLKVWHGRFSETSFIKAFFKPFPLLAFPSVIFATIVHGAFGAWVSVVGTIHTQVLAFPPYSLPPDQLAYIGLPGSAVSFIFSVASGLLIDWLIKFLARRNGGIYEPEFRLLAMIPAVVLSTLGFVLLGPAYAEQASVPKIVGLGLFFNAASPFASAASFTYIFDTLQKSSTEAFVATSLFRAFFSFLVLEFVPTWFTQVGAKKVFYTLAVLNLAFSALTIPVYIFGKKMRGAVSRNKTLMKITLEE